MSAVSAPERPNLRSARRPGWRVFLLQEWGLLLLAAALTLIVWLVVRDRVLEDAEIEDVEVQLKVEEHNRDRVAAVLTGDGNTVDLSLRCSRREKEGIEAQLKKDGWRVEMLVRDIPRRERGKRQLNHRIDRYQWKFAHERVFKEGKEPDAPEGYVFRLEPREVTIAPPPTQPPAEQFEADQQIRAKISVTPPLVNLPMPVNAEDEPLTPDPINLERLLERGDVALGQAVTLPLTFKQWRSRSSAENPSAYRAQVALPPVQATVELLAVGEMKIRNDLLVLIDQRKYEYDPKSLQSVNGVLVIPKLTFEGLLRGPRAELERLKKDKEEQRGNWIWGVRIKEIGELPEKPAEGAEPETKSLDAEIVLLQFKGFGGSGIRFVPTGNQDRVDLSVRWHPEHK